MVVDLSLHELLAHSARTLARKQIDLAIAHPFAYRYAEAFLRTVQDFVRQIRLKSFLEDVLALPVPKPILRRYCAHKVHKVDVQEWCANFE